MFLNFLLFFLTTISTVFSICAHASNSNVKEPHRLVVVFIPGAASSGPYTHFGSEKASKIRWPYFGHPLTEISYPHFICPDSESLDHATLQTRIEECIEMILRFEQNDSQQKFAPYNVRIRPKNHRRFVLVGHSMGGLIARAIATDSRTSELVQSVLTMSTPHRGTLIANFVVDPGAYYPKYELLWIYFFNKINMQPQNKKYLYNLLMDRKGFPNSLFEFQDSAPNPQVNYFSIRSSKSDMQHDILFVPHKVLTNLLNTSPLKENSEFEEDFLKYGSSNDGIVPELSMIFGQDLGHVHANHIETACTLGRTEGCTQTADLLHRFLEASQK